MKQAQARRRSRVWGLALATLAAVGAAVGYGIAQNEIVKQAEWAVYMVQAMDLGWYLPPKAKSDHYVARLTWKSGIEFAARQANVGTNLDMTAGPDEDSPGFVTASGPMAEAMYALTTLRPGEYGVRLRLAGGGALLKVGGSVFEAFQPKESFEWVDFNKVALDPGAHQLSVLFSEGARAEKIGITPPCVLPVEPPEGWRPLDDLTYQDMAVTIAKALDLENNLPAIGTEVALKGEEFRRVFQYPPIVEDVGEARDPFWLSSGNTILVARVEFTVPEDGLYAIETRYISPTTIRWVIDRCLRIVTCPVGDRGARWTRTTALELAAGPHEIEVTLPPRAALDRVVVRRRDGSPEEYLRLVEGEGFKLQGGDVLVRRRDAIAAARRLESFFDRYAAGRCGDTLISLEQTAALSLAAATSTSDLVDGGESGSSAIPFSAGSDIEGGGGSAADPLFPKGGTNEPDVSSPIAPE